MNQPDTTELALRIKFLREEIERHNTIEEDIIGHIASIRDVYLMLPWAEVNTGKVLLELLEQKQSTLAEIAKIKERDTALLNVLENNNKVE